MHFTDSQIQAIESIEGPNLIIAGPGSGKTAVLIERILFLIKERNINPENILAITFTVKASDEISKRLKEKHEFNKNLPKICTFHSLAYGILKENCELVGLEKDFEIVEKSKPPKSPLSGGLQNTSLTRGPGGGCFDDLIPKALEIFEKAPEVLKKYQEKYKYIMVDEFQDSSDTEAKFINLIAEKDRNICVIGDSDQAIYSFKGANIENFLKFKEIYEDSREIILEENFRSSNTIVQASQKLIENNKNRFPKISRTENLKGDAINLVALENCYCEARFIIENIEKLIGGSANIHINKGLVKTEDFENAYSFKDIVVLYRLNAVGKFLKKYFDEASIPYEIIGDESFFEKKEIHRLLEVLEKIDSEENLAKLSDLKKICSGLPLSKQIGKIIEICELKKIYDKEENFQSRTNKFDNILCLQNMACVYDDLNPNEARKVFLEKAKLSKDEYRVELKSDKIKLMSVHAAKGLEFPVVFVVACEEEIFPFFRAKSLELRTKNTDTKIEKTQFSDLNSQSYLEEERRLFYVAMTRAKEKLFITYSKDRTFYGERYYAKASSFINDIPKEFIDFQVIRNEWAAKKKEKERQGTLF